MMPKRKRIRNNLFLVRFLIFNASKNKPRLSSRIFILFEFADFQFTDLDLMKLKNTFPNETYTKVLPEVLDGK